MTHQPIMELSAICNGHEGSRLRKNVSEGVSEVGYKTAFHRGWARTKCMGVEPLSTYIYIHCEHSPRLVWLTRLWSCRRCVCDGHEVSRLRTNVSEGVSEFGCKTAFHRGWARTKCTLIFSDFLSFDKCMYICIFIYIYTVLLSTDNVVVSD